MSRQVHVVLCSVCKNFIIASKLEQHLIEHKRTPQTTNVSSTLSSSSENDIVTLVRPSTRDEECLSSSIDNQSSSINSANVFEKRIKNWTKSETLCLIEAYQKNLSIFKSNTIKNHLGWIQVSDDLKKKEIDYTPEQCQGKFKYLMACYKKKKDNKNETGSAPYFFEYFDQLDELFGEKPNITPTHLASSSRIYNGPNEDELELQTLKRSSSETKSNNKKKNKKNEDTEVQKRHKEKMAMAQLAIDTYKEYMDKILEKL